MGARKVVKSDTQVAEAFNLPCKTICDIVQHYKECGTTANAPHKGHLPKVTDHDHHHII